MALYEIEGLSLRLGGAEVLSIASLEIREEERMVLLGPNGSGKTSLLKVLAALVEPSAGELRFEGRPLAWRRGRPIAAPRRVVYLHQHPYIMAGSVSYNVEFGAKSRGLGPREAERRGASAMRLLGLEGFERRGHRALSGGEAQRVALARAIASGGDVLLLDEPTASADAASRELIAGALETLAGSGSTIILATHDEALARGSRVLRLERGRIGEETC